MELANEGDVGAVAAMLTLGSGLRASEVCNIRGRDIDDTFGPGDTLWIDDSKTKAGLREVEVPPELSPFLLELARTSGPDGKIFGNHWRDWPRLQVHRICRLVGIAEVSAHSMRGFYASRKLRDGEALEDVARDIGHEEGSTTTRSYASRGSTSGTNARGFSRLAQAFPKKPIETNGEPQPEGK
jgi:integrase